MILFRSSLLGKALLLLPELSCPRSPACPGTSGPALVATPPALGMKWGRSRCLGRESGVTSQCDGADGAAQVSGSRSGLPVVCRPARRGARPSEGAALTEGKGPGEGLGDGGRGSVDGSRSQRKAAGLGPSPRWQPAGLGRAAPEPEGKGNRCTWF